MILKVFFNYLLQVLLLNLDFIKRFFLIISNGPQQELVRLFLLEFPLQEL